MQLLKSWNARHLNCQQPKDRKKSNISGTKTPNISVSCHVLYLFFFFMQHVYPTTEIFPIVQKLCH